MKSLRVVLDTNILVSAIVFKGRPREVLNLSLTEHIQAITSSFLLAELVEVLSKKFELPKEEISLAQIEIENIFEVVLPTKILKIVRDIDDNKVIEAAFEGNADFIITGDKDLLTLGSYHKIRIITAKEFLDLRK